MEKEKDDATSPRDVLEACVRSYEDSNSSDTDNPRNESDSHPRSRWLKFFKMWKKRFYKRVPSLPPVTPKSSRKKHMSGRHNPDVNLSHFKSSWKFFTLPELNAATSNFSEGVQSSLKLSHFDIHRLYSCKHFTLFFKLCYNEI